MADAALFGVPVPDVQHWGFWLMALHALGSLYVAGFIGYSLWFRWLRRQALAAPDDTRAQLRFVRSLHGFPNAFYAKQFGMHALRSKDDATKTRDRAAP